MTLIRRIDLISEKNMELFRGNLESFTAFLEIFPILSLLRNCDVRYCDRISCRKKGRFSVSDRHTSTCAINIWSLQPQ